MQQMFYSLDLSSVEAAEILGPVCMNPSYSTAA